MKKELLNRHSKLQNLMKRDNVNGVFILQHVDLFYLTNSMQVMAAYIPEKGNAVVFYKNAYDKIKSECPLELTQIKSTKEIPEKIKSIGLDLPVTLGFEFDVIPVNVFNRYKRVFPQSNIIDASYLLRELKMVKSDFEVSIMRECGNIVNKVYNEIPGFMKQGITELELAKEIENSFRKAGHLGVSRIRGFNIEGFYGHVLSGESGNIPTSLDITLGGKGMNPAFSLGPSSKKIQKNEAVIVDYLCNYKGYNIDTTRTYVMGSLEGLPSKHVDDLYEIYNFILKKMIPGAIPEEIYFEALDLVEEKGLSEYFMGYKDEAVSFIGHGVGLELDEFPVIAPKVKVPLEKNMCIAVEPKLFFPPHGLIGIEDTLLITESGAEILSGLDAKIFYI